MTTVSSVIAGNNLAVMALENGSYGDAWLLMRRAILKLNECLAEGSSSLEQQGRTSNATATGTGRGKEVPQANKAVLPLQSFPVGTLVAQENHEEALVGRDSSTATRAIPLSADSADETCSFMYRKAIAIHQEEDGLAVVSAVVLYNLALCEHLLGTRFYSPKRIASAFKFYKCAYHIIEENRETGSFGDLLILAVINNIAACAAAGMELATSKRWFDFLGHVLEFTTPQTADDDYVFFSMNAMLNQAIVLISAPAA